MRILTTDNIAYDLNRIPDAVEDVRYCVFDYSDPRNPDYFFIPLIFLESYNAPSVVLNIGEFKVQMPLDWSVLACDDSYSDLEIMPLTSLNDRGFHTMVFNPFKHMVPRPHEVTIANVFSDVRWYFPKLKTGNILVVPLDDTHCPPCALFVKELGKISDVIDIGALFD